MRRYAMIKDPGLGNAFSYANNWDSTKIYGCACDPGYSGPSCTESTPCAFSFILALSTAFESHI